MVDEAGGSTVRRRLAGRRWQMRSCACGNYLRSCLKVKDRLRIGDRYSKRPNLKLVAPIIFAVLFCFVLCSEAGRAQQISQPGPERFTLEQAIRFSQAHFPEIRAALAKVVAARAAVGLSRTAYLPRTDLYWQTNRATYNNIAGLLLPQSVIPSLSGPVLADTSNRTAWGSAGGALLSWQPFDFGVRAANVSVARAAENSANFQLQLTNLDVSTAAADAFLAAVVAQQRYRAAEADVKRREAF